MGKTGRKEVEIGIAGARLAAEAALNGDLSMAEKAIRLSIQSASYQISNKEKTPEESVLRVTSITSAEAMSKNKFEEANDFVTLGIQIAAKLKKQQ